MTDEPEEDGQLYTLGLIEELRDDLRAFDGAKDDRQGSSRTRQSEPA